MLRFLIIRFSSIGDIVLTTPVVRCLKQQFENSEIHYVTKRQYVPIIKSNPYIDKIHVFDKHFNQIVSEIKSEKVDYIIDLHGSLRSRLLRIRLNKPSFVFPKLNFQKWIMVRLRINLLPQIHIVDRYMLTLKKFDVDNDGQGLDYFLSESDQVHLTTLPEEFRQGYIVLAAGAKHNTKQIPQHRMIALCDMLHKPVIILGGPEDFSKAEEVRRESKTKILNGCGKFTLNQSASIVKQSHLVITPDTGIMHIAAAFQKNILSLWGNTIPEFGMSPYLPGEKSKIYEIFGLSCRPCSRLGFESCPKKHFHCMMDLPVAEIASLANSL